MILTTVWRARWVRLGKSGKSDEAKIALAVFGFFQVFTTLIIIIIAALGLLSPASDSIFSLLLLGALVLSLCGDIALCDIENTTRFMIGLVLFLLAVCMYSVALSVFQRFQWIDLAPGALLVCICVIFCVYLMKGLGSLTIPVLLYAAAWGYFVTRAICTFWSGGFSIAQACLISFGAAIFFIGDIRLAIFKFKNPDTDMTSGPVTYALGQVSLALATGNWM
jgi:uncharacterized membrane protein YhhN